MRLLSLELTDFRSFHGICKLEFAAADKKRVTIFHGENGAGKTNLLNAIHWCVTGQFTPRFQDKQMLVNKEAVHQGRRECCVELVFQDEKEAGGKTYRVRRSATNDRQTAFDVFQVERGNSRVIPKGDSLLRMLLPPGLISWFFFDAEAIGSLELNGSEGFKRDLRKTLGFDLVDKLLGDLEVVQTKRRREVVLQTNDRELQSIQTDIENLEKVLPGQYETAAALDKDSQRLTRELDAIRAELAKRPQSEPLERNRKRIELAIPKLDQEKRQLSAKAAQTVGVAAPALILLDLTRQLEGKLEEQEVKGRLPSPYSDQLVKDILEAQMCVCGRPVLEGSVEAQKVHDLMKFASTGALNQRIGDIRYLIRDIERQGLSFPLEIQAVRTRIVDIDAELGRLEEELKEVTRAIQGIKMEEIQELERRGQQLDRQRSNLLMQGGGILQQIESNERRKKELKLRYDATSKKLKINERLRKELDKVTRLIDYIRKSAGTQESQALLILSYELNLILEKYLTKHYSAKIDPKTYAVQLHDTQGRKVGHSTGEGQVLKFAFIATVVAMAAKKTQQKIQWLSEPTIAPLVLDAPFSALDPEYQGSVAHNLAAQTTQLVLMISSAAWGEKVEQALHDFVGKRYLIVSKESGARGGKPIKKLILDGIEHVLNEYDAEITESVFEEIK
jgi:DNA sulfur modification protein DndD